MKALPKERWGSYKEADQRKTHITTGINTRDSDVQEVVKPQGMSAEKKEYLMSHLYLQLLLDSSGSLLSFSSRFSILTDS